MTRRKYNVNTENIHSAQRMKMCYY